MILPSLGLFWCLTCLGDAVTYCDINFFNFWTFLRNCDTGAIQSKTSQVIRSDVSSHIESDIAGQELLEELQELSYQVLSSKTKPCPPTWSDSDTIPHFRFGFRVSTGCVKQGDICWHFESFFDGSSFWVRRGLPMRWADSKIFFGISKYFKLFTCTVTIPDQLYLIPFCSTLFWPFDHGPHFQCFTPESDFTWEKDGKKKTIHRNVRFCCLKQTATAAWSPWMNGAMSNEASWVPSDGPGVWPNPPRRHGSWKCAPFRKILEYV